MIVLFFVVYTILEIYMLVRTIRDRKKSNLPELIGSYLFLSVFLIIKRAVNFYVPNYSVILIMLTIVGHVFVGRFLNYYNKSILFDRYLHAFGSFSFAIFSYCLILLINTPATNSGVITAIFVFSLGLALGCILELIEFALDKTINKKPSSQKSQRGLADTDWDMIFNVFGSLAAGVMSYFVF